MMRNRRTLAAPLMALAFAAVGCHSSGASPGGANPTPSDEAWLTAAQVKDSQIKVDTVANRPISDTVLLGGKVTFDDLRVTHVLSPVSGRVTKVLAQPGARVAKNAPLATLTSPEAGNALSDLVKAQADSEAARHEYQRQQELIRENATPKRDVETAQDNFLKAQAELERAKQKARLFSGSVDRVTQEFTLRAPIEGQVVARNVNLGMDVQGQYSGGNAAELFTIGELDEVWVVADVHEVDMSRVKVGADAEVSVVAYPGEVFRGKVAWVSDVLDPNTRTAHMRVTLPNKDGRLKPEMFATIRVTAPPVTKLVIPRAALLRLGDKTLVFISKGTSPDGKLRFLRKPVTVEGEDAADWVPISAGLQPGDQIVIQGAILLSEMV